MADASVGGADGGQSSTKALLMGHKGVRHLIMEEEELRAGWEGGLYGEEETKPIAVLLVLGVAADESSSVTRPRGDTKRAIGDDALKNSSEATWFVPDHAFARTTADSFPAPPANAPFSTPSALNSFTAVITTSRGRPVASARPSLVDAVGDADDECERM